jgi:hypothetical protein
MTVAYSTEIEILEAIRDRLRDKRPEFTEKTCFISDTPIPDIIPFGDLGVTICDGGSQYVEGTYMGAGPNALDTESTILITILQQCALDTPGRTEQALVNHSKGVLPWRKIILNALLVSDDQNCEGHRDQWVTEVDGYDILREGGPIPRGWSPPRYERLADRTYLTTTLTLTVNYDQEF